jgi:hypothetical protein
MDVPMRRKKYRDIVLERRILTLYHIGGYFAPLFPITVGYYLGVKALFGLNIYISGILAGLTGGLWSFGMTKGYDLYQKIKHMEPWLSPKAYRKNLHQYSKLTSFSVIALVVEFAVIHFFHL